MELRDYLLLLRRNWAIVIGLALLGGTLGWSLSLVSPTIYQATAQVVVSAPNAEDATSLAQANTVIQQRMRTYAELATSTSVLEPVVEHLGLDESPAALASRVVATNPTGTAIITITGRDSDGASVANLANAVAESLIRILYETESADGSSSSLLRFSLSTPASVPATQISPNGLANTTLGIILGLALGIAISLVRHALSARISSQRDIESITDLPVIGTVVLPSTAKDVSPFQVDEGSSPTTQSFRDLRAILSLVDTDRSQRTFVLTSPSAKAGTSAIATRLAITLAQSDLKVALIDADMRKGTQTEQLDTARTPGLSDVLAGRASDIEAMWRKESPSLWVLPSGALVDDPLRLLGSVAMSNLAETLDENFDVVIYDAPPLLEFTDGTVLTRLVGGALLITASGVTRSRDLDVALDELRKVNAHVSGLVLAVKNRQRSSRRR